MTKHIVVCIFCFLCAANSPCASHSEALHATYIENEEPSATNNALKHPDYHQPFKYNEFSEHSNNNNVIKLNKVKRDVNIKNEFNKIEDDYLKKLFSIYGDGNTLSFEGFENMIKRLDLIAELSTKLDSSLIENENGSLLTHAGHEDKKSLNCADREKILTSIKNLTDPNTQIQIDKEILKQTCPAILYTMMVGGCQNDATTHNHEMEDAISNNNNRFYVWLYSMLAVALISACGILGLAVIPVMQKKCYHSLIQFLVALAVGTLAGDALLHLLPHAMSNHEHGHGHGNSNGHSHGSDREDHDKNMWKGFVAMLGLILFFLMERIIMLVAKWRKKQQLKDKLPTRLKVIQPEHVHNTTTQLTNAADKQCKHKYSSFPYCYDEIKTDVEANNEDHHHQVFHVGASNDHQQHSHQSPTTHDELSECSCGHSHKPETNQNQTECPNEPNNSNCSEINQMLTTEIKKVLKKEDVGKEDAESVEYTVILREHENRHHGHTHTHGHVHAAPKTMSSVAWMVIMGDGLHNFTDGMAIGAAFSGSIAGGFSTAVAVFCHELPHELGDFAMLLKAGMSMKQALFYNLLSSFLCLFGNIFGVWLGATESATSWVFAAAAGMFLYIALVDMIPELSSGHEAEGTLLQCMLHLGGLLIGFGIMALIAMYEHDLKSIFHEP